MPAERFFIDTPLLEGVQLSLKEQEFHHLARVMRIRRGEKIEIINGKGSLAIAEVTQLDKHQALVLIEKIISQHPPENVQIILVQALPKFTRLDYILEKGTELGANQIWLFPGDLSVKKNVEPHQEERMKTLVIAAMKQCGRLFLPEIKLMPRLNQWTQIPGLAFFGDTSTTAPSLSQALKKINPSSPIFFFIGPESGFTTSEEEHLKKLGAMGVKLHQNILRTETASLVALSLISHWILN